MLAGRIRAAGYRVLRKSPQDLQQGTLPEVDAWVVDCPDDPVVADAMAWIDTRVLALSNRPDLSELEPYRNWCQRIINTLDKWNASYWHGGGGIATTSAKQWSAVKAVWILAGSTGGVSAVAEFLSSLKGTPPVAFVYAQHIDGDQQELLTAIGHANKSIGCTLALGRHWLNPGQLLIVPASHQLVFGNQGEVFSSREPWSAAETPSIDELMLNMAGMTPPPQGAIVFSGAGRDGGKGARALRQRGTQIWAEDPDQAASPSMLSHLIELNLCDRIGSPSELAAHFETLVTKPDTAA